MKKFLGVLFHSRDVAHSAHLNTRSFAKHKALDSFYHDIVDLADNLAETYQGKYGLIGPVQLQSKTVSDEIAFFLQQQLDIINKMRYSICDKEDTPIQNLIDEIVELYLSTLYKLKFLS